MKSLKRIFLPILLITSLSIVTLGQELIEKKEDLNIIFKTEYHVLKSNRKIKQGLYTIINKSSDRAVALGNYTNNVVSGTWMFFNFKGELEQRFNFDKTQMLLNKPIIDSNMISYQFPVTFTPADTVLAPIKIGGFYYGCSFISETNFEIVNYIVDNNIEKSSIKHHLNIDENGRLISWESVIAETGQTFNNSIKTLPDFFKLFIPAQLNHKKIVSTLVFTTITRFSK